MKKTGKKRGTNLAKLVLECKMGRVLDRHETTDHKDNNKLNDDPENLEVLTRSENSRKGSLGIVHTEEQKRSGSKNGMAKLTDTEVLEFRIKFEEKSITKNEIMITTGMSDKAVRNFLFGESYTAVPNICSRGTVGRPKRK